MRRLALLLVTLALAYPLAPAAVAQGEGGCAAVFPGTAFDTSARTGPVVVRGFGVRPEVTERFAGEFTQIVEWLEADITFARRGGGVPLRRRAGDRRRGARLVPRLSTAGRRLRGRGGRGPLCLAAPLPAGGGRGRPRPHRPVADQRRLLSAALRRRRHRLVSGPARRDHRGDPQHLPPPADRPARALAALPVDRQHARRPHPVEAGVRLRRGGGLRRLCGRRGRGGLPRLSGRRPPGRARRGLASGALRRVGGHPGRLQGVDRRGDRRRRPAGGGHRVRLAGTGVAAAGRGGAAATGPGPGGSGPGGRRRRGAALSGRRPAPSPLAGRRRRCGCRRPRRQRPRPGPSRRRERGPGATVWPRRRSPATRSSGIRDSATKTEPLPAASSSMCQRGWACAAAGPSPATKSRAAICRRYCGCWWPPRVPRSKARRPSRVHRVGERVWRGRLPGAASLGWPGCSEKHAPRLWSQTPVPPADRPLPMPVKFDWIKETPMPAASSTAR